MSKLGIFLCTVFFVSIESAAISNPWDDLLSISFRNASIDKKEVINRLHKNNAIVPSEGLKEKFYAILNSTVNDLDIIFDRLKKHAKNKAYNVLISDIVTYEAYKERTERLNDCLVENVKKSIKGWTATIVDDLNSGFEAIGNIDEIKTNLRHTVNSTSHCTDRTKTFVSALKSAACFKLEVFETNFNSNFIQNLVKIMDLSFEKISGLPESIRYIYHDIEFDQFECDASTFQS